MQRIIFDASFRSLVEALDPADREMVVNRWRELGIDTARPLPGYPAEKWVKALEVAVERLDGSPSERLRSLGRGMTRVWSESLIGRATAPLARLTGTRRTLLRSPITFRSGNNFLQVTIERDEPNEVQLRTNDSGPGAELLAGSIEELVLFTGGRSPQVTLQSMDGETRYVVRWT